ncbi:MAG: hypothetical protein G01um101425_22 [Candidatus Peregrinibacteria bacterium Gr01-1014_25]|nr:MAG: hypothetical protein G01um101425_22 [Candidatus Peregrinibacteria bacterium Gr01-1014_25]
MGIMSLLSPTSIAVVGASTQPGKVGHDIFVNLATQGFTGELYAINPKAGEIAGHATIPSLSAIGKTVDLAVIVTPAPTVAAILEECGALGIKNAVVISAGFAETSTEEGRTMESALKSIAKKYGILLIGPNCLGILRPSIGMNASFAKSLPPKGGIALISQSGATAVGLIDGATAFGLSFASVISIGNKTVLDECDYVERCAADPETRVIGLYLESIRDGRRFLKIARDVAAKTPIVLLKSGVSEHGSKAAASHTGALAGSDAGVAALCRQAGIHRAWNTEEFLDLLCVLNTQPPLLSPKVAIITNAGGPGILATDAAETAGLQLPALDPQTVAALKGALPSAASTGNPIDVIGDAGVDRYTAALKACAEDPNIDGVVALLTPQVMTPCDAIARAVVDVRKKSPLMPVTTSFLGGSSVESARAILRAADIPTFDTPERAVRAMGALRSYEPQAMNSKKEPLKAQSPQLKAVTANIFSGRTGLLPDDIARQLFAHYDLSFPKQGVAKNEEEAVRTAADIGYPVILKIQSPDILHKTDVGGIRGNLQSENDVRSAIREILANAQKLAPKATIDGVLVQQFFKAGDEFIVGAVRDPAFGTLLMAGLGGIYTELFRDTAFRMAPVTEEEAYVMLQQLTSWTMLLGARGKPQSDIPALARLIVNVGRMVTDCPQIKELDVNPVLVSESGAIVADAKVIVD